MNIFLTDPTFFFFFQFNIVNEKMYEILGLLYKEMFQLFDPDVFHFGGDEVATDFFFNYLLSSSQCINPLL